MYLKSRDLDWKKWVGIYTDGAGAMCGKRSSVLIRIHEISPDVRWTHCNIHRVMFVSKHLSDNLKSVLDLWIKILVVNYIKTKPLQSWLFAKLLIHTELRWLSRGKFLTRLLELRSEITFFEGMFTRWPIHHEAYIFVWYIFETKWIEFISSRILYRYIFSSW